MSKHTQILSALTSVLGSTPDIENSFIAEGGDSFNALILIERIAEETNIQVDLNQLLSDVPLKNVLELE